MTGSSPSEGASRSRQAPQSSRSSNSPGGPTRRSLFGTVAALALRALGATWRVRVDGDDPLESRGGAQIGAIWHRDLLITAWMFRDRRFSVAVSRSRDGDRISAALEPLGYRAPLRGSSSRSGAAALRGMVRLVRDGTTVSVLMDGPRGPARRPKIGVVSLARLTGVPITPVAFSARPCVRFSSWDRTLLPLPFARVWVRFGAPIAVTPDVSEDEEEALRQALETAANAQSDDLDRESEIG